MFGQGRIGVYNIDSLKSELDLCKWINNEKASFLKQLNIKAQAKGEEHSFLIGNILKSLHLSEEELLMYEDSIQKVNTRLSVYIQKLKGLKTEYDIRLDEYLRYFFLKNIALIKPENFDLILEEEELLYHDTKTVLVEDITKELARKMNFKTGSFFFIWDWNVFKTHWRLKYSE